MALRKSIKGAKLATNQPAILPWVQYLPSRHASIAGESDTCRGGSVFDSLPRNLIWQRRGMKLYPIRCNRT